MNSIKIMAFVAVLSTATLLACSNQGKRHKEMYYHGLPAMEGSPTEATSPAYTIDPPEEDSPSVPEDNFYSPSTSDETEDDGMEGFDPPSEDDMDDNGMTRFMENDDDEGWD